MGLVDPATDDAAYGLLHLVKIGPTVGDRAGQGFDDGLLEPVERRVVLGEAAGMDQGSAAQQCQRCIDDRSGVDTVQSVGVIQIR